MSVSQFYSDNQIEEVYDKILKRINYEYPYGYCVRVEVPDKRYKGGKRSTWENVDYSGGRRYSSERKKFIEQVISDISNDETFTILTGLGYLYFFTFMRNPFLRNKGLRTIKKRIRKNYKDRPGYKEQQKDFMSNYRIIRCFSWIFRLMCSIGIGKNTVGYTRYEEVNDLRYL